MIKQAIEKIEAMTRATFDVRKVEMANGRTIYFVDGDQYEEKEPSKF